MVDIVLSARFEDQTSAGADAAAAKLDKFAASADNAAASSANLVTEQAKAGPSATTLVNRYDEATAAAVRLQKALDQQAAAQATMAAAVANGSKTQAQANAVNDAFADKVKAAKTAVDTLGQSNEAVVETHDKAAAAAGRHAGGTAGVTRELLVLGHEAITGNYTRMGGSFLVLAERTNALDTALHAVGDYMSPLGIGMAGLGLVAVGTFAVMAVQAESAQRALNELSGQLSVTRNDYSTFAAQVQSISKATAFATPGLSTADANAAGAVLAAAGATAQQLGALEQLAQRVAVDFGVTVPEGAKKLAEALKDPAKEAQALADGGLRTMSQALVDTVKHLEEAGDRSAATALVLKALQDGLQPVKLTEFQTAMDELGHAFGSASVGGHAFGDWLMHDLSDALKAVAETIRNTKAEINGIMDAASRVGNFLVGGGPGATPSVLPGPVNAQIAEAAQAQGFSADKLAFANRVAYTESGGTQFDGSGNVLTSGAGAQGIFQLMPGTARGLGVDATSVTGNISGGLRYINQLWQKYGGDPQLVAMAYNWGPANVDAFIAGTKTAVPTETKDYVLKVTGQAFDPAHGVTNSGLNPALTPDGGVQTRDLLNSATKTADKILGGTAADTGAELQREIDLLTKARAEVGTGSDEWKRYGDAIAQASLKLQETRSPLDALLQTTGQQIAAQITIGAAYDKGAKSVVEATNFTKAEAEARKIAVVGTEAYYQAIDKLTASYNGLSAAQADNATKAQLLDQSNQLETLQKESDLLLANTDTRNRELAVLKERQDIIKRGGDLESEASQKALANTAAIADATTKLQEQQQTISDLTGMATQAFDQVGQAVTQAFVSGQGAAVNFGNVFKGIIASVLQEVAKLAVINPLLNSIFGGSRSTLDSVGGLLGNVLGNVGSEGSAGSVGSGLLSGGLDFGSATGSAGSSTAGAGGGGFSLGGLTGPLGYAGLAFKAGNLLTGGALSSGLGSITDSLGISGLTNAVGLTNTAAASATAAGAAAETAATGATTAATAAGTAVSTIGAALPYVGTAITAVLDIAKGNYRGAGLVLGGAAIGTAILPGIGTAIGAAAGALIDAVLPMHKKNIYSATEIDAQDGRLAVGNTVSQLANPASLQAQAAVWTDGVNKFLDSVNLKIANSGIPALGSNTGQWIGSLGSGIKGLQQTQDITSLFGKLTFAARDQNTNFGKLETSGLAGQTFADPEALRAALIPIAQLSDHLDALGVTLTSVGAKMADFVVGSATGGQFAGTDLGTALSNDLPGKTFHDQAALDAEVQTVNQFVNGTMPALVAATGNVASSYQKQLNDLGATYSAAIAQAKAYGLAIGGLQATWSNLVAMVNAQIQQNIANTNWGFVARQNLASADPATQLRGTLINFDLQANAQRDALRKQFLDYFGDAGAQTQQYADTAAQLETTLGLERLAIIRQANAQITAADQQAAAAQVAAWNQAAGTAASTVASLAAYANKLETSNLSALSPQQQYYLSGTHLNSAVAKAAGGDNTALSQVSGYADTFLTASRAINGSGAAYANDFKNIVDALDGLSTVSPDMLTASVLRETSQAQTQTLVNELQALRAEVVGLKTQMAQNTATPARVS